MTLLNLKKNESRNIINSTTQTKNEPKYLNSYQDKKQNNYSQSSLMIGQGVSITGTIKAENEVIIQGKIDGDIDCNNVSINKSGIVKGKIQSEIMTVEGKIEGEFNVNSILHIKSNGSAIGKISYGNIQIDEGGKIFGEIKSKEENNKNATSEWKAL